MRPETDGFTRASHEYERGRPGYPADVVDWIAETASLGAGRTVVDLAAGTGKFTSALLGRGAEVIAVEPLAEMRARLAERLPEVQLRAGRAEDTGLPDASADAVTVAQAFHWFANEAALAEIQRVLKPSGVLALVWNRRDFGDPIQAELGRLTALHVGDAPSYGSGKWERVMAETERFSAIGERRSSCEQIVDRQRLVDRVASTSYIAMLRDEVRLPLLERIGALVPEKDVVTLSYLTTAYAYRRR